jgi:dihydrofolate synthase / folylpolyglutamate synthase
VGILKPGAALITPLDADDEAGRVLAARADELRSPVTRPPLDAATTIEDANAAIAGAALDQLGEMGVRAPALGGAPVGAWLIDAGARAAARLPGRMERFDIKAGSRRVPVVLDGAHVPFNIAAVLRDLALTADLAGPCVAIVALAADKDAQGFVAELGKRASTIIFTDLPGSTRGRSPVALQALAGSLGLKSEIEPEAKRALARGLEHAAEGNLWLIVTGSLYLIGALRSAVAQAAKGLDQAGPALNLQKTSNAPS